MNEQVNDLVIDLGTTNLCISIFRNSKKVFSHSIKNSLHLFGPDVITRLSKLQSGEHTVQEYQEVLFHDIVHLISLYGADVPGWNRLVIGANTIMLYFFLGKDAIPLGQYPYSGEINRGDIELLRQNIKQQIGHVETVSIPPILGGQVGADMQGVLYWIYKGYADKKYAVVDIGTNAEMAVKYNNKLYYASAAAGTAFGIIGSTEINMLAEGLRRKEITRDGLLLDIANKSIKQSMIRNLQLAKAAVFTGFEMICDTARIEPYDIDVLYIAGLFGNNLKIDDIKEIRLMPFGGARIQLIGNAALAGLELMMLDDAAEANIHLHGLETQHIELANTEQFNVNYMRNLNF